MRPMGSHRSCTRSRLMPVGVRLPTAGEFARRPCSPRHLHGSAPLHTSGFRPMRRSATVSARLHRFRPARHIRRLHDSPCLVAKAQLVSAVSPTATGRWLTIRPPLPHVRRSFSPPQRCLCARHANGTSRAPADSTFPFPVSAALGAAEPLHPSFSLSFPCPKSFSRGCC